MASQKRRVKVLALEGSPRSGKGTIGKHIRDTEPMTTHYETGIRYRTVAFMLKETGVVELGMPTDRMAERVERIETSRIASFAGETPRILEDLGEDALYTPEIDSIVPTIGSRQNVRPAIKDRLRAEIEKAVDSPDTQLMVLDGRRLQDVARAVSGVDVILNLFVVCSEETAASREVSREKERRFKLGRKPMTTEEEERMHKERVVQLKNRRKQDEDRTTDKVIPEGSAMSYWHNSDFIEAAIDAYANIYGIPRSIVRRDFEPGQEFFKYARIGAGAVAYGADRAQIVYDSNSRNLQEMCGDARLMLREARDASIA